MFSRKREIIRKCLKLFLCFLLKRKLKVLCIYKYEIKEKERNNVSIWIYSQNKKRTVEMNHTLCSMLWRSQSSETLQRKAVKYLILWELCFFTVDFSLGDISLILPNESLSSNSKNTRRPFKFLHSLIIHFFAKTSIVSKKYFRINENTLNHYTE